VIVNCREKRYAYRFSEGKPEGKSQVGRSERRREGHVKTYSKLAACN
jgi:hypothetical protein